MLLLLLQAIPTCKSPRCLTYWSAKLCRVAWIKLECQYHISTRSLVTWSHIHGGIHSCSIFLDITSGWSYEDSFHYCHKNGISTAQGHHRKLLLLRRHLLGRLLLYHILYVLCHRTNGSHGVQLEGWSKRLRTCISKSKAWRWCKACFCLIRLIR